MTPLHWRPNGVRPILWVDGSSRVPVALVEVRVGGLYATIAKGIGLVLVEYPRPMRDARGGGGGGCSDFVVEDIDGASTA